MIERRLALLMVLLVLPVAAFAPLAGAQRDPAPPAVELVAPTNVLANATLTFTTRVAVRAATAALEGHVVEVRMSPALRDVTFATTAGCAMTSDTTARCALPDVAPGTNTSISVTGRAPADPQGQPVGVSSTLFDAAGGRVREARALVNVTPLADVGTISTPPIAFGGVYGGVTVGAYNLGPSTATNVTASWGGGAVWNHIRPDPDAVLPAGCTQSSAGGSCNFGTLAPGESRSYGFRFVMYLPTTQTLVSQFAASSTTLDANQFNNRRNVSFEVRGVLPRAAMGFEGPDEPVLEGDPLRVDLTAFNAGEVPARRITGELVVDGASAVTAPPECVTVYTAETQRRFTCDFDVDMQPFTVNQSATRAWPLVVGTGATPIRFTWNNSITEGPGMAGQSFFANHTGVVRTFEVRQPEPAAMVAALSGPADVHARETATYVLDLRNAGLGRSSTYGVSVSLAGPGRFVSTTPSVGECTYTERLVTCALGVLEGGASANVRLGVYATGTGALTLAATPSEGATEPATLASTVGAASADIVFTRFTSSWSQVTVGEQVVITMAARNDGPSSVNNAVIETTLPAGFDAEVDLDGPCVRVESTITCFIGTLMPGQEKSIDATVTASAPGSFTANASARSGAADPNGANDARTLTVTVTPA